LATAVARWPTPTARDHKDGTNVSGVPVNSLLGRAVQPTPETGALNPTWVEWLMGFPIGWTVLERSEMPLSRKSRSGLGGRSSRTPKQLADAA